MALIHEQTLPNMTEVGKNLKRIYLLKECLNFALNSGKFNLDLSKLQLANDLDFVLTQELIEYEDWMEACNEFIKEYNANKGENTNG